MRRTLTVLAFALLSAASPAAAQQSVNLFLGGFSPLSEDSRSRSDGRSDDVLVNNLNVFDFEIDDFDSVTFGGEWLVALGNHAEAGLGLGFYSDSVDSVYRDLVNEDFSEIQQDLKLRIVPFTGSIPFLPLGNRASVQPYIGTASGVLLAVQRDRPVRRFPEQRVHPAFVGSGGAVGPVIMGGVRDRSGQRRISKSATSRPKAICRRSGIRRFEKIDLGGFNYLFTTSFRF